MLVDAAQKLLAGLHVPPEMQLFVVLGLACFVSIAVGFLAGLKVSAKKRRRGPTPSGRRFEVDSRIQELNRRIRELVDQNELYNRFMMDIPHIIRRLNATVSRDELAAAIVKLAVDMLETRTVYLYAYHPDRECLERIHAAGAVSAAGEVRALGEGIVGCAAKDLAIKSAGSGQDYVGFGEDFDRAGYAATKDSELTMAAPIHSEKRLIGVLGIGHSSRPSGVEKKLLGLVAQISAVTMANRAFLGAARREATTDPLTGLFNRRYFDEKAREYAERAIFAGGSICIFLFDIDNFKNYNDTNGHDAGDVLLKDLSNFVQANSRKATVVARYGGEEFIVMLPNQSKEETFSYADRLRELLAEFPFPNKEKQPLGMVSISGGIACFPSDGRSIQEVTRHADAALYRAKEGGRNRIELHDPFLYSATGTGAQDSPPAASAEPDHAVSDAGGYPAEFATPDGSGSFEPDGATDTGTVLVTLNAAPPPGPTVHVPAMDVTLVQKGSKFSAKGRVSIVDDAGTPVQGVAVTGEWRLNGVLLKQASKATNEKGVAKFDSGKVSAQSGDTLTITIINASKEGYAYDPAGNVETSGGVTVP